MDTNKGWECPKCGKVYAPSVDECKHCNGAASAPVLPMLPPMPYTPPITAPQPYILPTITQPHTVAPNKWPGYPAPYIGDWPFPPIKITWGSTVSNTTVYGGLH